MIVASDLNGTLTTGSPIFPLATWAENNSEGLRPKAFKVRLIVSYLWVKLGFVDTHTWADKYLRKSLNMISSPTPERLDQAMAFIVENELWPKRKHEAVNFLKELHDQGAEIILVSAAFEPAVDHFGKKISLNNVTGMGTPVIFQDGKLSLADKLTIRERKRERLREKLGTRKLDYALGDSIADLPMLEAARNTVAVTPDKQLRKIALERDWRIIE
jgi:HAD superfamily phosphoserine phosphatase-like hydrolase